MVEEFQELELDTYGLKGRFRTRFYRWVQQLALIATNELVDPVILLIPPLPLAEQSQTFPASGHLFIAST